VSTTLIICLVTTIAGGGAVLGALKPLKLVLPGNPADHPDEEYDDAQDDPDLSSGFIKWDRKLLKPIFIRGYKARQREFAAQRTAAKFDEPDGSDAASTEKGAPAVDIESESNRTDTDQSGDSDDDTAAKAMAKKSASGTKSEFAAIELNPVDN
jgi:hypothetical protein